MPKKQRVVSRTLDPECPGWAIEVLDCGHPYPLYAEEKATKTRMCNVCDFLPEEEKTA